MQANKIERERKHSLLSMSWFLTFFWANDYSCGIVIFALLGLVVSMFVISHFWVSFDTLMRGGALPGNGGKLRQDKKWRQWNLWCFVLKIAQQKLLLLQKRKLWSTGTRLPSAQIFFRNLKPWFLSFKKIQKIVPGCSPVCIPPACKFSKRNTLY
jgi:hypothetical protein